MLQQVWCHCTLRTTVSCVLGAVHTAAQLHVACSSRYVNDHFVQCLVWLT